MSGRPKQRQQHRRELSTESLLLPAEPSRELRNERATEAIVQGKRPISPNKHQFLLHSDSTQHSGLLAAFLLSFADVVEKELDGKPKALTSVPPDHAAHHSAGIPQRARLGINAEAWANPG